MGPSKLAEDNGRPVPAGLIHHSGAAASTLHPFTPIPWPWWAEPSIGGVGHAYDNEAAETVMGLFKNEVVAKDSLFCTGGVEDRNRRIEIDFEWEASLPIRRAVRGVRGYACPTGEPTERHHFTDQRLRNEKPSTTHWRCCWRPRRHAAANCCSSTSKRKPHLVLPRQLLESGGTRRLHGGQRLFQDMDHLQILAEQVRMEGKPVDCTFHSQRMAELVHGRVRIQLRHVQEVTLLVTRTHRSGRGR